MRDKQYCLSGFTRLKLKYQGNISLKPELLMRILTQN